VEGYPVHIHRLNDLLLSLFYKDVALSVLAFREPSDWPYFLHFRLRVLSLPSHYEFHDRFRVLVYSLAFGIGSHSVVLQKDLSLD
jgi:hypothetical protein